MEALAAHGGLHGIAGASLAGGRERRQGLPTTSEGWAVAYVGARTTLRDRSCRSCIVAPKPAIGSLGITRAGMRLQSWLSILTPKLTGSAATLATP